MASLHDQGVQELLTDPNYAVISTLNRDGSVHNTIIWISAEDDAVAVNSALGRKWPTNLQRDPRVTVLVQEDGNPYRFVEIRGTATATREGAVEHINALAKKYNGQDKFTGGKPGDERIKFVIRPQHVRYVSQA
jgi:PPOX class probable F420-dependent enzyme